MKGKGIVKKFLATVILTIMMFASCSQVISYAATVYLSDSGYTLNDSSRNETLYKFNIDDNNDGYYEDLDIYCLRGGARVNGIEYNYNKVSFISENPNNNEIVNFESNTNVNFKTDIDNYASKSKNSSIKAVHWLIKNMVITYSSATTEQKNNSKQNLLNLIKTFRNTIYLDTARSKIDR